jgi:hypothetical protein
VGALTSQQQSSTFSLLQVLVMSKEHMESVQQIFQEASR